MFLGIDGGASKTAYALCNAQGHVLTTLVLPTLSVRKLGENGMRDALSDGVGQVCAKAGIERSALSCAVLGMAAVGEGERYDQQIHRAVAAGFGALPHELCNDAEVAWAGSLAMKPGINVLSGTGTNSFGVDAHGNKQRCGGWGSRYSDEGSGYWLGKRLISIFCRQADGRIPERGPVYRLVYEAFGLRQDFDFIDVMEEDYMPHLDKIASLQPILLEAAKQGDPHAIESYREAGCEIAQNVLGLLRKLDLGARPVVSYSGGVLRVGPLIMDSFRQALEGTHCILQEPKAPPWAGALMMALRSAGRDTPDVMQQLLQDSNA